MRQHNSKARWYAVDRYWDDDAKGEIVLGNPIIVQGNLGEYTVVTIDPCMFGAHDAGKVFAAVKKALNTEKILVMPDGVSFIRVTKIPFSEMKRLVKAREGIVPEGLNTPVPEVVIRGHSDDIIIVEGAGISEEFYPGAATAENPTLLVFSEGTIVAVWYDHDGEWRVLPKVQGLSEATRAPPDPEERGSYTDTVTLRGEIDWVVHKSKLVRFGDG